MRNSVGDFIFRMNSENFLLFEFQPFHAKNCHDFPKKLKWHIEVKIETQKFWKFILYIVCRYEKLSGGFWILILSESTLSMKFWNEFIWYDAKLDHNEIFTKKKNQKKKLKKISKFWTRWTFWEINLTLTLNHYFDSIYLISSSKSSIPHNRHVSTIYVLKVKKCS